MADEPSIAGAQEYLRQERIGIIGDAVLDPEPDPQRAARATRLAQATGVPPVVIYSDIDHYEQQNRVAMTAQILDQNARLRDFAASNPIVSKAASNDWGNLDGVSEVVERLNKLDDFVYNSISSIVDPLNNLDQRVFGAAGKGFAQGWDFEGQKAEFDKLLNYVDSPWWRSFIMKSGAGGAAAAFMMGEHAIKGSLIALAAGAGEVVAQAEGSEAEGAKATRDALVLLQLAPFISRLSVTGIPPESVTLVNRAAEAANAGRPWTNAGKPPPYGINPDLDAIKVAVSEANLGNLDEAVSWVHKSELRKNIPDLFRDFIRQHTKEDISISAAKVQEIYGTKVPKPDDGILGFVPDLAEQLAREVPTGGDIKVKLADYLAYVKKEVHVALKDGIRVRPQDVTKIEKAVPAQAPAPPEVLTGDKVFDDASRAAGTTPVVFVSKEPPIVQFKKDATAIESRLPAVPEGTTRLWRGNRPGEPIGGTSFTSDLPGIALPFQKAYGGDLSYIDVPTADLPGYQLGAGATDAEFGLPPEMAGKATVVEAPPAEPKAPFAHAPPGMDKARYLKHQQMIDARVAKQRERIEADVRKRETRALTKEWKEKEAAERVLAVEAISKRPDVAAYRYFQHGEIAGRAPGPPVKIRTNALTREEEAALKGFTHEKGLDPEVVAPLFGFGSGQEMVDALVAFNKARGTTQPMIYTRQLIADLTASEMERKYGTFNANLEAQIKEHILDDTELARIHEEHLYLAELAGSQTPLPLADLRQGLLKDLANKKHMAVSSDSHLTRSHMAARIMEEAFLKGDAATAFKASQQRELNLILAKEAVRVEKLKKALAKTVERFAESKHERVMQTYTDFIQDLLQAAGFEVDRFIDQIRENQRRAGFDNLSDFIKQKAQGGRDGAGGLEIHVPYELAVDGPKLFEDMTVAELYEFKNAIDSLEHVGRVEMKEHTLGTARAFKERKEEILANIESLPKIPPEERMTQFQKMMKGLFEFDAILVRMEEIAKDLDLRKEYGPLWTALIEPMVNAKHIEYKMQEKLAKDLVALKGGGKEWIESLQDSIPQDFFFDPKYDKTDTAMKFDLKREHMLNIMMNFGSRSNIDAFTRGYSKGDMDKARILEQNLRSLFTRHATKADWEFVQGIWDIFGGWTDEIKDMYYRISGIQPEMVEAEPIHTNHGTFPGGYFPVMLDRERSNLNVMEGDQKPGAVFEKHFYRATTGNTYLRGRIVHQQPVSFIRSIEEVAARMQQQIHDIAYREAVISAGKVIYDKEIRTAIRDHYGAMYEKQLEPWLNDIANHYNYDEEALGKLNDLLRRVRFGLMADALGLNLKVILSPDVGFLHPGHIANVLRDREANVDLAHKWSREIPHTFRNMDRDFREKLEQLTAKQGLSAAEAAAVKWGWYPLVQVSQGFRVVTFVTEFKRLVAEGHSEEKAASMADSYVRERHGSAGIADIPAVMRGPEAVKMITMFYGYFNSMYNWQRQIPGAIRRGDWAAAAKAYYGAAFIPAIFGAALFNKRDEEESYWAYLARALILGPLQNTFILRDLASMFSEGYTPKTGLATFIQTLASVYSDASKIAKGEEPKKPIVHTLNAIGIARSLPLGQIGKTVQGLYDVNAGKQEVPANIYEWINVIVHGEVHPKKGVF